MVKIKYLMAFKALFVLGLALCWYQFSTAAQGTGKSSGSGGAKTENASGENQASLSSRDEEDEGEQEVPEVPKGSVSLGEGLRIREQLEFLRKDVVAKITKLQQAKKTYDRAKSDVEEKLRRIEEERRLLEETLQREKQAKVERLTSALEFVAKMEPRKAAPMLETMDKDLVILLLRKLPPRQVTKILENVSPKKATEFMEYYTKIRSGREYSLLKELGLCQAQGEEREDDDIKKTALATVRPASEKGKPQAPGPTPATEADAGGGEGGDNSPKASAPAPTEEPKSPARADPARADPAATEGPTN